MKFSLVSVALAGFMFPTGLTDPVDDGTLGKLPDLNTLNLDLENLDNDLVGPNNALGVDLDAITFSGASDDIIPGVAQVPAADEIGVNDIESEQGSLNASHLLLPARTAWARATYPFYIGERRILVTRRAILWIGRCMSLLTHGGFDYSGFAVRIRYACYIVCRPPTRAIV